MIIQTDDAGKATITQISDWALKHVGIQAFSAVTVLFQSMKPLPPKPEKNPESSDESPEEQDE